MPLQIKKYLRVTYSDKMVGGNDEKDPKPAPKGDQITEVIGEVGKWQLTKILIVFIAAAPG